MSNTITCPQCKNEIEVTEVLSAQLGAAIRSDLEAEYAQKLRELATDRNEIATLRKQLDDREASLDKQVKVAIANEREQLVAKSRAEAKDAVAIEIRDRDEQLEQARLQLKTFQQQELDLRKKQRELQERAEQQDVEIARRLDEEREKIRSGLEAELARKTQKLAAEREQLLSQQKQLDVKQTEFEEQIKSAINNEREQLITKVRAEAQEAVAADIRERAEQLEEAKVQLKAAQQQELSLRKKQRELDERAEQQELELARKLDEERLTIREAATKQAQEQNELKIAERDQKIVAMGKQLQEMQRRLEQGSQQTQGEVQEIALEQLLAAEFPSDVFEPVAKGAQGGDVLHHVFDSNGRECGTILWESKRTKRWNEQWFSKAIDDQQGAKASITCIVTAALPPDCDHFGEHNGVWITSWPCVRGAAAVLRCVLLEAAQARRATDGQHGKLELVYNYLSGPEFRNRVRGLVEPYIEMQKDLIAEKNAYNKHWKKREKQLDRALVSTTGMYGDLQGIIGSSLGEIDGMDMLALEARELSENADAKPLKEFV